MNCYHAVLSPIEDPACTSVSKAVQTDLMCAELSLCITGGASASEQSPGKYARKTGAEVGSELSLALLTTIREAVASRTSSLAKLNVRTCHAPILCASYGCSIIKSSYCLLRGGNRGLSCLRLSQGGCQKVNVAKSPVYSMPMSS